MHATKEPIKWRPLMWHIMTQMVVLGSGYRVHVPADSGLCCSMLARVGKSSRPTAVPAGC